MRVGPLRGSASKIPLRFHNQTWVLCMGLWMKESNCLLGMKKEINRVSWYQIPWTDFSRSPASWVIGFGDEPMRFVLLNSRKYSHPVRRPYPEKTLISGRNLERDFGEFWKPILLCSVKIWTTRTRPNYCEVWLSWLITSRTCIIPVSVRQLVANINPLQLSSVCINISSFRLFTY